MPALVGGLKGLKHLDILKCRVLSELPESIGLLRGLRILSLGGQGELDKVGGVGLQELKIHGCGVLGELREKIGLLPELQKLKDSGTPIRDIPALMEAIMALRRLSVFKCRDSSKEYWSI